MVSGSPLDIRTAVAAKSAAALAGDVAFVPGDLKLLARAVGLPPAVGHHGNAVEQPAQIVAALDLEGRPHARQLANVGDIGTDQLAAMHVAFLEHGVEHSGHADIDAEDRLAGDDARHLDVAGRLADDAEGFRVLQLEAS